MKDINHLTLCFGYGHLHTFYSLFLAPENRTKAFGNSLPQLKICTIPVLRDVLQVVVG
jgi:hypothetical protein